MDRLERLEEIVNSLENNEYDKILNQIKEVILKDGVCNIKLTEKCSYVILKFNK